MKLIRCHVENFGKLEKFDFNFQDGINTIKEENGWGKTTLATFIKAMFFGLPSTTKRSLLENERKKYIPWQGGRYGGNIVFENNGIHYRVERFFADKDKDDVFVLYNENTGLRSMDYSARIGEELFGINQEGYERSTFIPQKGLLTSTNDSINAKLSHLMEDNNDINNYEAAIISLEDAMKFFKKTGSRGKLAELEEQISALAREIERFGNIETILGEAETRLEQKKEQLCQLREASEENKGMFADANVYEAKLAKKDHYAVLCAEAERAEQAMQSLQNFFVNGLPTESEIIHYTNIYNSIREVDSEIRLEMEKMRFIDSAIKDANPIAAGNAKGIIKVYGIMAFLFWTAGGVLFSISFSKWGAIGFAIAGFIMLLLLIFGIAKMRKQEDEKQKKQQMLAHKYEEAKRVIHKLEQQKKENMESEIRFLKPMFPEIEQLEVYECLSVIKNNQRALEVAENEYLYKVSLKQKFEVENDTDLLQNLVVPAVSIQQLKAKEKELELAMHVATQEMDTLYRRIEGLQENLDTRVESESEKERLSDELVVFSKQYDDLEDTAKYLKKSKESFSIHYQQDIKNGFTKYMDLLCEAVSSDADLDIKFNVKIEAGGAKREIDYYSEGYKDLIGICMRFALVDALFKEETPFIIMDDPFANLDEEKLSGALRLLTQLGKEYQILYFVCHKSRAGGE